MAGYRSPLRPDANEGRVAVVTGGGTGIGRATALELAATGARLVVCGRREEPLARVSSELEELGGECLIAQVDGLGFELLLGYSWTSPERMRERVYAFAAEQLEIERRALERDAQAVIALLDGEGG